MKRLIALVLLLSALGIGCSSNTVLVRALEPPKWPVHPARTIAVVAVVEDKQGQDAHLTRDLAAMLQNSLTMSAYYTKAKRSELLSGEFNPGKAGERIPVEQTIASQAEKLGTDLLLFVEILGAKVWIDLDRVSYGVGIGTVDRRTAFGTSIASGANYWNAESRILVSAILTASKTKTILASRADEHSSYRSYGAHLPSESGILQDMLKKITTRLLTYVDVYFQPSTRCLRSDGSKLISDGIRYAMLGGDGDWDVARQLWRKAYTRNPDNLAANYNLAVEAEVREDYPRALSFYKAARALARDRDAFSREIAEASISAEVIASYGEAKKEADKPGEPAEPKQPPPPPPPPPGPAPGQ